MNWFDFKHEQFPRFYLRIWHIAFMYWPNSRWYKKFEVVWR